MTRPHLLRWFSNVPRLIGWAVVAMGVFIVISQVRSVVREKHGLPNIRHPIYWTKNLQTQARLNRSAAVSTELAPFYLIERVLKDVELIIGPDLAYYRWRLERIGRARVTVSDDVVQVPVEAWKGLALQASHTSMLGKHKLYLLKDAGVKTYVVVSTVGETGPVYVVPENVYRSRAVVKSGANLSAP